MRPGSDGAVRRRAVHVRQHGVDARRPGAHPGTELQQGPQQAVLLLVAGHPAAHRPRQPESATDADGARAQGDFSQTFDSQGRLVFIRDPLLSGNCSATTGGPACFPGNVIPANRIDPDGQALLNLFPLPNATDPTGTNQYNYAFQTAQDWPRNDQVLRMDWNVAPEHDVLRPPAVRLREALRRRVAPRLDRRLAAAADQVRDRHGQLRQHAAAHVQPDDVRGVHVGVNWSHQYTSPLDQAALDANDRHDGAARPAAVLPAGQPAAPAAAGDRSAAGLRERSRRSASSSGSRSSATTRCSTSRATSRR